MLLQDKLHHIWTFLNFALIILSKWTNILGNKLQFQSTSISSALSNTEALYIQGEFITASGICSKSLHVLIIHYFPMVEIIWKNISDRSNRFIVYLFQIV